jgi:uncharacterized membrane protein YfcA
MDLIVFAVWCFLVAVAGNMRLPAAVLVGSSPGAAAGANIGISAVSAATASIAHIRAGRVNWQLFGWMAPPSILGALAGGYLGGVLPGDVLLVVIAAVLLYSGVDLFRWTPPDRSASPAADSPELDLRAAVATGAVIGLLGGIVGLILGSLRMPALLRVVHETPQRAVGTNVTVGVCVGVAGVIGHLPSETPDWDVLAVGAAASIPGALIGSRLTGRLSEPQLVRAIAFVLLIAAAGMIAQAAT